MSGDDLLRPQESLDDDNLGDEDLDSGYSPPDHPWAVDGWGTTAREAATHEDLAHRLARELPDTNDLDESDGIGDTVGTDGEPVDAQAGQERAGRLVAWDVDELDSTSDYWARDIGIDAGAASAEEAAIHVVTDLAAQ